MFDNIEIKVETTTVHSLIIALSEAEVTEALVNPSKLLKRLRQERAKWHARPAWSATGHADSRPRKGKKATEKKRAACLSRSRPNPPRTLQIRSARIATTPSSGWPSTCPRARIDRQRYSRPRTSRSTTRAWARLRERSVP